MASKCEHCKGSKEISPLGSIVIKCKACNGIGYVVVESKEQSPKSEVVPKSDQKKRGRPKSNT